MASRYDSRIVKVNSSENYREFFKERKVNFIRQFGTPELEFPSPEDISELQTIGHIWSLGDRFYKLAHEHYGDAQLWWVIAHYNQTPTESHVEIGETVYVPHPLERVLEALGI